MGEGSLIHKNIIPDVMTAEGTTWGEGCKVGHWSVFGAQPAANAANRRKVERHGQGRIGDRSIVGHFVVIYAGVFMAEDCRVGDHANIREGCRIGARCVIGAHADIQYNVLMGDDVQILNGSQIAGGTVIGSNTFIGPGVQTANDAELFKFPLTDYRDRGRVAPIIGSRVKIGVAAVILPGVTIGDDAEIAAGAVVTRDVAAGAHIMATGVRGHVFDRRAPAGAPFGV
jgi:UDP-2-acetamido-3-amino-2,3-dideoxy-glucuronate N-acetyltransferase